MVAGIFETEGLVFHFLLVLLPKYCRMQSVGLVAINGW